MIKDMHVTFYGNGVQPVEDDVLEIANLNNLVTLLEDLDHCFDSGDVGEDRLSL